ncbi:MAG: nucleotidyltransferase domain-containing protein [Micromonosporaceae bacterium]|nr:nucleotidyltransferase domain-containing protein [Micromonosporaceae bacterium]
MCLVPSTALPSTPPWHVAEDVADAVQRKWTADVVAIGVHGALAHGDESGSVDIVVVTYREGAGPAPNTRRIDGVIVDLGVIGAEEYLRHARTLSTSWPLAADQYLTTKPLFDPDGWHDRLRDTHLARLAEATGRDFATLAREAWCHASSLQSRARRLAEWYDTDGAVLMLGEARVAAALVDGLLTRTYFRDSVDAVHRTSLDSAHIDELGDKLTAQAEDLAKRGRPVDGGINELLG